MYQFINNYVIVYYIYSIIAFDDYIGSNNRCVLFYMYGYILLMMQAAQ